MNLKDKVWIEKYRPSSFSDLVLEEGVYDKLHSLLSNPAEIPSFIFYSSAGTGKTSCAYIIVKELGCDSLILNASDERGIDTIRDKVSSFASSLSSKRGVKRCVIMEESDSMTGIALNSLRNIIETYSSNVFFIFTCNDISKIIEPIRSRCIVIDFNKPNKDKIFERILYIVKEEKIEILDPEIEDLIEYYYPDIRSMVGTLQNRKIIKNFDIYGGFKEMLERIRKLDFKYIASKTFSGSFDVKGFNKWLFRYIFKNYNEIGFDKSAKIAKLLAEIEMNWNLGVNFEIIFLANMMEVGKIFNE